MAAASMVIDANFFMSLLSNPPNPAIIPLDLAISKHPITTIITLLDLAIDSNSKDPTVLLGLPLVILLITDLNSSSLLRINGPVVLLPLHRVNDLTVSLPIISNFFYLLLSIARILIRVNVSLLKILSMRDRFGSLHAMVI